ncbi:hypothetical protein R6Q59_026723 [Mikania micrantha]
MGLTNNFLLVLLLTLYHVYFVAAGLEPYTINVIDGKINHLVAHISSNDKDFGNKSMTIHDTFKWNFRRDVGEMIRFRGEFFWMNPDNTVYKEANFHVFDNDVAVDCGESRLKVNKCSWLVTDTGFYFAKGIRWVFIYNWQDTR